MTPDVSSADGERTDESNQIQELSDMSKRQIRALTEYHTVLDNVGSADPAAGKYTVVSQSGNQYDVDIVNETCSCPDHQQRQSVCKHIHRARYALGVVAIPAAVDKTAIDSQMGEHVDGEPIFTDEVQSDSEDTDDTDDSDMENETDDTDDPDLEDSDDECPDCARLDGDVLCWDCEDPINT